MRQQINLYQDVLLDRPEPLQSRQAGILLGVVLCCLAGMAFYCFWQADTLRQKSVELKQQEELLRAKVSQLEKDFPEPRQDALLKEKIVHLEAGIKGKKQALNYFSSRDREGNGQILGSLEGLAKFPLKGVWLREVRLHDQGREVLLSGSALNPEQVPEYLQLLGRENVFGGQVFARLKLQRLKERARQIDFELDSRQEARR